MFKISSLNDVDQNQTQVVEHVLRTFSSTYIFQLKSIKEL